MNKITSIMPWRLCLITTLVCTVRFALAAPVPTSSINYTYEATAPSSESPDTTGHKLADGVFSSADVNDSTYVIFADPGGLTDTSVGQPQVLFNLGTPFSLSTIQIDYGVLLVTNGFAPDDVKISFSIDGLSFSAPQTFLGFDNSSQGPRSLTLNTPATAEFVRMDFESSHQRVYLGEVTFNAVPEPSSWALIIVGGGVGFFFFLRRKQNS